MIDGLLGVVFVMGIFATLIAICAMVEQYFEDKQKDRDEIE